MFPQIFFLVCFLCFSTAVQATPPSKIDLSYDENTKKLHIDITHPSSHLRKHHIRKITILKNDKQVQSINLTNQTNGNSVIDDIFIEAVKGDIIKVKAKCSDAGPKEESLIIP